MGSEPTSVTGRLRLLAALLLPTLLVAGALFRLEDLRWAFFLYVVVGCWVGPWILVGLRGGLPFTREDERLWTSPTGAPLAVLVFGPLFFGAYALLNRVLVAPEAYLAQMHALGWNDARQWVAFALFVGLIPISEEFWWRRRALPLCVATFGSRTGLVFASVGFALYHLPVLLRFYEPAAVLLRFAGIGVAAFLWTWIAHRRRSWGWTFWAHLAADLTIVAAFLVYVAE